MKVEKASQNQAHRVQKRAAQNATPRADFASVLDTTLAAEESKGPSEEEIFSSLVKDRVKESQSVDAIKKFEERVDKHKKILNKLTGDESEARATKFALRDLTRRGLVTKDEATQIYSMAFNASQVDDEKDALASKPTPPDLRRVAGAATDLMASAKDLMLNFVGGANQYSMRSLGEGTKKAKADDAVVVSGDAVTPNGTDVDGHDGFLFKPVSDNNGNLVILVPADLTGNVASVVVKDSEGNILEEGRSGGVGNGGREHFRYGKPGASYPANTVVEVRLNDGTAKQYLIPDPSQRYD